MFGQNENAQPAGGPSFAGTSFDRRPRRLPLGQGEYEIIKVATRKTTTNFDEFYCVLKCLGHEDAQYVGSVFEFSKVLQGAMLKSAYREIGQLLMFSFGKAAAELPSPVVAAVLDKELLADNWTKFNATQAIEGKPVVGNRVRIRGYNPGWGTNKQTGQPNGPKTNPRTGQPYESPLPRYVIDVAG